MATDEQMQEVRTAIEAPIGNLLGEYSLVMDSLFEDDPSYNEAWVQRELEARAQSVIDKIMKARRMETLTK